MTLSAKLGVVEISTLWHFRLPLLIQMFIKVASSPRLSGIGMPSPILWSHLLKMQRIVLLSSLLCWELGTNSLITGPGEWLSLRRFTSKLSWSWSWSCGQRRLIRLGGCPGWSESSLGAQPHCWFCHEVAQMVLRQSLQNKYSYVYRKTTGMQKDHHFTCNQNKMAKTHSCSNRIIYGHISVHPQEIVRQIFAQIVSLRQITNIIYHVYISNNKNKHFPP